MSFPSSPTDKQVYKEHYWDDSIGAWMKRPGGEVGDIRSFGGTSPPIGHLECDGSEVSRDDYDRLFDAIGETWGSGDGSSTFNLPDLRGVGLRGAGQHGSRTMAGGDPYDGGSVGDEQADQMQRIEGSFFGGARYEDPTGGGEGAFSRDADISDGAGNNATGIVWDFDSADSPDARTSSTTGGETRGATSSVNYCIRY